MFILDSKVGDMAQALDNYTIQNPKSKPKWSYFVQQPHKLQESRMQQQQKRLCSTYYLFN